MNAQTYLQDGFMKEIRIFVHQKRYQLEVMLRCGGNVKKAIPGWLK